MTKPAFTPGPWRVSELAQSNLYLNDGGLPVLSGTLDDNHGRRICVVDAVDPPRKNAYKHQCAERDANAALIAAAPDIYAALKASRIYVETCDTPDVLRALDAALAKAEGRS